MRCHRYRGRCSDNRGVGLISASRMTITGDPELRKANTDTIRRTLITVPARIAYSARKLTLHLPTDWPWEQSWITLFDSLFRRNLTEPQRTDALHAPPRHERPSGTTRHTRTGDHPHHTRLTGAQSNSHPIHQRIGGFQVQSTVSSLHLRMSAVLGLRCSERAILGAVGVASAE